ncbi:DinB family protein [Maribacter sp. CXY002]|uniref:DinB family protein n=1 Tax=Maribacter luteocoastalis TaxID=3407671 RepID=UPI003B682A21
MRKSELHSSEYGYFYATYLNALEDVDLCSELTNGKLKFEQFLNTLPLGKLSYRYSEGKWTIEEVLQHIIDSERVFQYRAFHFSKNDRTPLPGFEQDDYVSESERGRNIEDILHEFNSVRNSTISLFKDLPKNKLKRIGTASGMPWSVAALGFVICGHQQHHLNILKERYLYY